MKKLLPLIAVCIYASLVILPSVQGADDVKIGYVNAQRIIEQSKAGKEAYSKLKALQEKHKQIVESKKAEIDQKEAELQKQYLTLSEKAKAEKELELRQAKTDFKRMLEDADNEIAAMEKTYLGRIDKEVMNIIENYGKEQGYMLILGQVGSSVLYASPEADVTDAIIQIYDTSFQSSGN